MLSEIWIENWKSLSRFLPFFISLLYRLYWIVFTRSVVIKLAWHMTWTLCKEYILNKNLPILSQVKHVFEFSWDWQQMCWDRWPMDHMNKAMGRAATLELVLCFVCSSPPTLQSSPPHAQLYQSHQGITSTPLDTPFHPQNNDWAHCKKRQDDISGPSYFLKMSTFNNGLQISSPYSGNCPGIRKARCSGTSTSKLNKYN